MSALEPWQWVLAGAGALLVGVSKTGIAGLGMVFVAIFANLLPAKEASGFVLPMLIFGDVVAVTSYRRHTQWRYLWRLFPWTAAGVLVGWWAMGRIDNRQASALIGGIIVVLIAVHLWRRRRVKMGEAKSLGAAMVGSGAGDGNAGVAAGAVTGAATRAGADDHGVWFAPTIGVLAGFTTLVANAAGPLMAIYLLAMRLPKMEFVGTGAVFFLLLNCFKVPFMVNLDLITVESFGFNLLLAPVVFGGAMLGRWILPRINQRVFEYLALGTGALAGVRLLWAAW